MTEPQIFGTHEPKTLDQLRDVASRAERAALMADGHLGYVMPIGGVAAYRHQVSVVGVGFDIGRNTRADDAPSADPRFRDPAWAAVLARHGVPRRILEQRVVAGRVVGA